MLSAVSDTTDRLAPSISTDNNIDTFEQFLVDELFLLRPLSDFKSGDSLTSGCDYHDNGDKNPTTVLIENMSLFLYNRTKVPHDVLPTLPAAITNSAWFLLSFENITSVTLRETEHTRLVREICEIAVTTQHWSGIVSSLGGACFKPPLVDGILRHWQPPAQNLTPFEHTLADNLVVAACFDNEEAIMQLFSNGANLWTYSHVFGYPLVAAAMHNEGVSTVHLLLDQLPSQIKKSNPNIERIQYMFHEVIVTLTAKNKLKMAATIARWYAEHVSVVVKTAYNHCKSCTLSAMEDPPLLTLLSLTVGLSSAIKAADLPLLAALLSIKQPRNGPRILYDHFDYALRLGDMRVLNILLKKGNFELNKYYHGRWPLREAIKRNKRVLVCVLLQRGADPDGPNPPTKFWNSPLRTAIEMDDLDIVRILLQGGARVGGYEGLYGQSDMLVFAQKNGQEEIVNLLQSEVYKEKFLPPGRKASIYLPRK